jgi:hypothetical protein
VSRGCSGFGQHGKASAQAKGEVSIPGGDGSDRVLQFQEQLHVDFEDPWVFIGGLPSVPTEYLTVTALLDPVSGTHLAGRNGDVEHGVEAIVGFETLGYIVGRGVNGVVKLLFQHLNTFLKGFGKGFMVIVMVVDGVFQCLDLVLQSPGVFNLFGSAGLKGLA